MPKIKKSHLLSAFSHICTRACSSVSQFSGLLRRLCEKHCTRNILTDSLPDAISSQGYQWNNADYVITTQLLNLFMAHSATKLQKVKYNNKIIAVITRQLYKECKTTKDPTNRNVLCIRQDKDSVPLTLISLDFLLFFTASMINITFS